jgi:hypothetical protein
MLALLLARSMLVLLLRGITIVQADNGGDPAEQAAQDMTP